MSDDSFEISSPSKWEPDTPAVLPIELQPFVQDSDKFFSPTKQKEMAEKRKDAAWVVAAKEAEKSGIIHDVKLRVRPSMIRNGLDLLILREKTREGTVEARVPFCVGAFAGEPNSRDYDRIMIKALDYVDSCLYLEDREGKKLTTHVVASRLRSAGIKLPPGYREFEYLENSATNAPSYWPDADNYAHLCNIRHRIAEDDM